MPIDFRLKSADQVTSGLVMELVPGSPDDAAARRETIYIDEDAFGFVEPCVWECWPAYRNYGHWGQNDIPVDVWRAIVVRILAVRESLVSAAAPEDVVGLGFIFPEVRLEFFESFDRTRAGIVGMIDELVGWFESKVPNCRIVALLGI